MALSSTRKKKEKNTEINQEIPAFFPNIALNILFVRIQLEIQ